jgi:hypothetical protein
MEADPVEALFVIRNVDKEGMSYDRRVVRVFHCLATVTDKYRVDRMPLATLETTIESEIHIEASAAE